MSLEAVIVPKISGIEWDMERFGFKSPEEVIEKDYRSGLEEEEIQKKD